MLRRACVGVAAFCAFLAAALVVSSELGGLGGDDAEYVLLARSLRENFTYVTTWTLGEPAAHTTYPPLLPLMLVPFVGEVPESFLGVHLFLSVASGTAVGLLTLFVVRRGVHPVAAGAAALGLSLSALWLRCATDVLSELPFLAFVLGALLALDTDSGTDADPGARERHERPPRAAMTAAVCAAAAVLTRTAGVALVPWVLLALVVPRWRGGRSGRAPAAVLVAVTVAWFAYGNLAGPGGTYLDVLTSGVGTGDASLPVRFWNALFHEYIPQLPAFVFPDAGFVWDAAGWAFWAFAIVGVVVGVSRTRRLRAPEGFALTYLTMLCAWNFSDPRFGVPLVPFLVLFVLEGATAVLAWARPALRVGAVIGVGLLLLLPNAVRYSTRTRPRAARLTPVVEGAQSNLRTPDVAAFHATWGMPDAEFPQRSTTIASYLMMCAAIRDDSSAPAGPVMAANPRIAALLTGRTATTTSPTEAPSAAIARMRASGVELLLVDSFVDPRSSAVRELVRRHGNEMGEIGRVGNAYLYQLRPPQ